MEPIVPILEDLIPLDTIELIEFKLDNGVALTIVLLEIVRTRLALVRGGQVKNYFFFNTNLPIIMITMIIATTSGIIKLHSGVFSYTVVGEVSVGIVGVVGVIIGVVGVVVGVGIVGVGVVGCVVVVGGCSCLTCI